MNIKTETIAKGTLVIIIATFASKILGFIREILIAKYYGASVITDSYLVATILPTALAGIIGGALTTVFIPLFIEEKNKNGDQKAWEVASSVIITSVIYLGIATLAAYFISPYFIRLVAPGFDLERYSLSLRLNQIMLPSIVFHGLLGLLTGLLQAYRHFSIPALALSCIISFDIVHHYFLFESSGWIGNWKFDRYHSSSFTCHILPL